jgi:predicted PurR-regulated permease PerM
VRLPRRAVDVRAAALTGLFILACVYTLYLAEGLLLPIVLSVLLKFVFEPVVRSLRRVGITPPVSAALIVLTLLGTLTAGLLWLRDPAAEWVGRLPEALARLERTLDSMRGPVDQLTEAAEQVEAMAGIDEGAAEEQPQEAAIPPLGQLVLVGLWNLVASASIVLVLLYFLLASGDFFQGKVVKVLPRLTDKKRAVEVARQIEEDVSHHLLTITLINLALGGLIAAALGLIGMPNPMLWGLLSALLNYIPYLGPLIGAVIAGTAAFLHFEQPAQVLLVVGIFVAVTSLEGSLITPLVLGRRLALNPVAVFLNLFFWGWIWGTVGALIAVPMLVAFKALCDRVEPLAPVAEFLGR